MTRQDVDRTLQKGLVACYATAVLAGIMATAYTPPSMAETIGDSGANAWGWLTLLGGACCLLGVIRPRGGEGDWFGEYVGLWPLVTAVGVYAVVVLSTTGVLSPDVAWAWPPLVLDPDADPGRSTGGLLLIGFTALLVVRWFRVRDDAHREDRPPTPRRL